MSWNIHPVSNKKIVAVYLPQSAPYEQGADKKLKNYKGKIILDLTGNP
jgi:hypothetical protein